MKDGIRFVTSIASNPYTDSNTLSSLAHPFVEGCVATSPITCNFIECIAALLIKKFASFIWLESHPGFQSHLPLKRWIHFNLQAFL